MKLKIINAEIELKEMGGPLTYQAIREIALTGVRMGRAIRPTIALFYWDTTGYLVHPDPKTWNAGSAVRAVIMSGLGKTIKDMRQRPPDEVTMVSEVWYVSREGKVEQPVAPSREPDRRSGVLVMRSDVRGRVYGTLIDYDTMKEIELSPLMVKSPIIDAFWEAWR